MLKFLLRGIAVQSKNAIDTASIILQLNQEYKETIRTLRRTPEITYRIIDEVFESPVISISKLSKKWDIPYNTVKRGIRELTKLNILNEAGSRKRYKLFIAPKLMSILLS